MNARPARPSRTANARSSDSPAGVRAFLRGIWANRDRRDLILAPVPALTFAIAAVVFQIAPLAPLYDTLPGLTPVERGGIVILLAAAAIWYAWRRGRTTQATLRMLEKNEEERRAIAAIGVGASWDLELNHIYRRFANDLKTLLSYDHLAITSATSDGRMQVVFSQGVASDAPKAGTIFDPQSGEPDGLTVPGAAGLASRLTMPVAAINGTVTLRSRQSEAYGPKQRDLLRQVIAQISPGIANARIFEDSQRQVRERTALAEIGRAANSDLSIDHIFERVASALALVIPFDRLSVTNVVPGVNELEVAFVRGVEVEGFRVGDRIARHDESEVDYRDGREGILRADITGEPAARNHVASDLRSWAQVTLEAKGHTTGYLSIRSRKAGAYSVNDLDLLERVAQQISPAIENARLFAEERALRTQLDEQNRQLHEANQAKSRFLSTVSHELKTPLTIISGFVDLLSKNEQANLDPEQVETLGIISKNATRLGLLINDILDISRIDAGTFKLDIKDFPVNDLFEDLRSSFKGLLANKSQDFITTWPEERVWLRGDRNRLAQLISNLLSNASKYSPAGRRVELTAVTAGDRLHVSVRDHGIGISPEEQAKLFTAFYRVDNQQTREVPGTGLGLVIAKSIVELHGGKIWLESEPGKGTTMHIEVPGLVDEPDLTADAAEPEPLVPRSRLYPDEDVDDLALTAD